MKTNSVIVVVALMFLTVSLMSAPSQVTHAVTVAHPSAHGVVPALAAPVPNSPHTLVPRPALTFPRTVLIETFTGVWCPHCPAETQSLFNIDRNTSHNVVSIAELHVCALAPPSPCYENYVPPDNTSNARGAFYNVCGFPDVFVDGYDGPMLGDGLDQLCGASNSAAQMGGLYERAIANASAWPGNVSISQVSNVTGTTVNVHANITSGITGSYNVVSYLLEFINKQNQTIGSSGPHDIANVVRETLRNHPVSLTAGESTLLSFSGAINRTWNDLNLSVITLVQENSTKHVENVNMVPVTTMMTGMQLNQSAATSGTKTSVSLQVTNSTTGAVLSGAAVNLTSSIGGSFSPSTGVTSSGGTFTATFTAPVVVSPETAQITATVTQKGYTNGIATSPLVVNPIILSNVPTGLTVTPADQQVMLNWTVPASGSGGVTYHVYRANSEGGAYTSLGISVSTTFVDSSVVPGQTYWYAVDSHNAGGFSANSTSVSATSINVVPNGLPAYMGWWFSVDSINFSSATNGSFALFMPQGSYFYAYGPGAYGFVASVPAGPMVVTGAPATLSVTFSPLYATLEGTVNPSNATVTVDGATIAVTNGAYLQLFAEGTYTVVVSSPGYTTNSSSVTLTAGNSTTWNVNLHKVPIESGPLSTSTSPGGLSGDDLIVIVAVVAVVGVAAVLGGIMLMSRGGRGGGKTGAGKSSTSPRSPRNEP